jgi:hypothetical protein
VKAPPRRGPTTLARAKTPPKLPKEKGAVFEAGYLADDSEDRDEDARGADTLYGAGKDEDVDVGTDTADETAELEDADREQVEVFRFCDGEELAKREHEPGLGD